MATLIAYASKHGATEKCAKELQKQLTGGADLADLRKSEPDLSRYDAVILGVSIYAGMPRKQMKAFIAKHAGELARKKLGLFLCCQADGEQAEKQLDAAYPPELRKAARAQGVLGSGYDIATMNFFEKFVLKKVSGKEPASSFNLRQNVLEAFIKAF